MKLATAISLGLVLIFVGLRAYDFFRDERALTQSLSDVQTRLAAAKVSEADLEAQTQFLSNPVNMEKELRANFNYTKPGEKMIIMVPAASATTTATNH
jgi:cell division protein FtsB